LRKVPQSPVRLGYESCDGSGGLFDQPGEFVAARYPLRMTSLRFVDELSPVPAVAPRPPFVHLPA
jgi:hypothetical protein